jgi:hypothetical protein
MISLAVSVAVAAVLLVLLLWLPRRSGRVVALGRDTYIRLYPNPGVGVRIGRRVFCMSVHRGIEIMRWDEKTGWRRSKAWLSKVRIP